MASKPVPQDTIDEAIRLYNIHRSTVVVGRMMNVDDRTVGRWMAKAGVRADGHKRHPSPIPVGAHVPPSDMTAEEIIATREVAFNRKMAAKDGKAWREIHINTSDPVVIIFFGDPHLDDDGANWPLLREHIELAQLPNVYGVNIGDTTNNWVGRLMRLYANQDLGVDSARKLAKWFLCEAGINWFCWIFGNHDAWNEGNEILSLMNTDGIVMEDWQARVTATFPTGMKVPIWISHNFPGNSQWNLLHGPMKAAKMRGGAAIYACGHTHTWAMHHEEMPETGDIYWAIRSRGYKFMDSYANVNMFPEFRHGASIAAVIDPRAKTPTGSVVCFTDPAQAVKYQRALKLDYDSPPVRKRASR
jgi:hypothetical protein